MFNLIHGISGCFLDNSVLYCWRAFVKINLFNTKTFRNSKTHSNIFRSSNRITNNGNWKLLLIIFDVVMSKLFHCIVVSIVFITVRLRLLWRFSVFLILQTHYIFLWRSPKFLFKGGYKVTCCAISNLKSNLIYIELIAF